MNKNKIITDDFSSEESKHLYETEYAENEALRIAYKQGYQCGGCSFFAPFNEDYGLCCFKESKHFIETVFEHFTCSNYVNEGWGVHSFTTSEEFHCKCQGESKEEYEKLIKILEKKIRKTANNWIISN